MIIVGRDPEIAVPRPPSIEVFIESYSNIQNFPGYFRNMLPHGMGQITPEEKAYVPEFGYPKVFFHARTYVLIYAFVIFLAIYHRSSPPLMYIGLPNLYGCWLMPGDTLPSRSSGPARSSASACWSPASSAVGSSG